MGRGRADLDSELRYRVPLSGCYEKIKLKGCYSLLTMVLMCHRIRIVELIRLLTDCVVYVYNAKTEDVQ